MPDARDRIIDRLETQAGEILRLLRARTAKRPVIIEFSGSPKAGKTTAIGVLALFFRRNHFRVEVFTERAAISPISNRKGYPDFNVWVSCASLQGLLESREKNIDLFILDRGVFDALIWNRMLSRTGKLSAQEAKTIEDFFAMEKWAHLVDLVCMMRCDPATSIEREYANQLTKKRGTIMETGTLKQFNLAMDDTLTCCAPKFKSTIVVDTTHTDIRHGTIEVAKQTLGALRQCLDESMCVLHRSKLAIQLPNRSFIFDRKIAEQFIHSIDSSAEFMPRSKAEQDENYLIPIPCAVVMFQKKLLILRRKEEGHVLHDTYAIWAGGHVMESDSDHQNIILNCLRRELREELHIQGGYELQLAGIVRTDQDERCSRHIGIVYTARLHNDCVSLASGQKEFRMKRGTSVSGTLIDIDTLKDFFVKMGDWSKFIAAEMWPE
jgi:predicted NUDIX family phosphoesterase